MIYKQNWSEMVAEGMRMLQKESELNEIVRLVRLKLIIGKRRLTLEVAEIFKRRLSAIKYLDDVDTFTSEKEKQFKMIQETF